MDTVNFLRLNVVDNYNNDMNRAGIVDHLSLVYKTAMNLQIAKWWQAILFWAADKALATGYNTKPCDHYAFLETHCLVALQEKIIPSRPK